MTILIVEFDEGSVKVGVVFSVGVKMSSTTSGFVSIEMLGEVDEFLLFGLFILEDYRIGEGGCGLSLSLIFFVFGGLLSRNFTVRFKAIIVVGMNNISVNPSESPNFYSTVEFLLHF